MAKLKLPMASEESQKGRKHETMTSVMGIQNSKHYAEIKMGS